MIQIGKILVSLDIIDKMFICDLKKCKGHCCVEGDAGAPLSDEETVLLDMEYDNFKEFIPLKGRETVKESGKWVYDWGKDKVTPLNNGEECAYSYFEDGIAKCGIEKAWTNGKTNFRKPVSCHLYPIRVSYIGASVALNFHSWSVCQPAILLGEKKGMPVYKFLREAIIRVFGTEFYDELNDVAEKWTLEHGS